MPARDNYLSLTGYRLPTEAEREFACRGGTVTLRFHFGQTDALLGNYAWYQENGEGRAQPVARLKPNDFGLFDMHGNVWEWCECPSQGYPMPTIPERPGKSATTCCPRSRRVVRQFAAAAPCREPRLAEARQPSAAVRLPAREDDPHLRLSSMTTVQTPGAVASNRTSCSFFLRKSRRTRTPFSAHDRGGRSPGPCSLTGYRTSSNNTHNTSNAWTARRGSRSPSMFAGPCQTESA